MTTALLERPEQVDLHGLVHIKLWRADEDGAEIDVLDEQWLENLVTEVGDQYYGERAAGIGSPPAQVSGMRLGTGATAAAKTGAGAAIVTYITASSIAITGGFPTSSKPGSARRIQWQTLWAAGTATNAAITEAVITNEASLTNVAGTAANTVSRVVFTAINKGALDSLTITWSHDLLGA